MKSHVNLVGSAIGHVFATNLTVSWLVQGLVLLLLHCMVGLDVDTVVLGESPIVAKRALAHGV